MTTGAAENTAGRAGDKEKVEKRRALGRGLESLLPGPRAVGTARPAGAPTSSPGDATATAGELRSAGRPGAAAPTPVPAFVRSEKGHLDDKSISPDGRGPRGEPVAGAIRAVADEGGEPASHQFAAVGGNAELRSAGQPGATGPTFSGPDSSPVAAADGTIAIYAQAESQAPANLVVNLAIADIDKNPFQTRSVGDDEKLEELSDSIKANGVVQPIMVRPGDEEGRYILVLGERRLLASKKAGKTHIPALLRRVSLQQAAEMTIIENLQREDLSALEQAEAFRVLSKEFSLTQAQIGERVGLSRESVSNYMRLLKLPVLVLEQLAHKQIGFSEAKELLKLEDPDLITKTADYIVKKHLTLDQIETLVLRMTGLLDPVPGMPGMAVDRKKSGARWVDPNVRAAQLDLEQMLGVRVRIRDRKGKGKIVIEYHTVDDYERVVEMLRGKK
jgi:ParB family transcriptional regulator, chromosome partitioning protein